MPGLDILIFLHCLMASTMPAAVEARQMDEYEFQTRRESDNFVSLLGAIEECTVRELGTQQLRQLLRLALGLHLPSNAFQCRRGGAWHVPRYLYIPKLLHFLQKCLRVYPTRRVDIFDSFPSRSRGAHLVLQGRTSDVDLRGYSFYPFSSPSCNGEEDGKGRRLVQKQYEGLLCRASFCEGLGSGNENLCFGIVESLCRDVHLLWPALWDLQIFKEPRERIVSKQSAGWISRWWLPAALLYQCLSRFIPLHGWYGRCVQVCGSVYDEMAEIHRRIYAADLSTGELFAIVGTQ